MSGRGWLSRMVYKVVVRRGYLDPKVEAAFMPVSEAECVYPARVSGRPLWRGALVGRSETTGKAVTVGLHDLYEQGVISGPNAVIVGGYGLGKSSLCKTVYVLRALAQGVFVAVFDRKRQRQSGRVDLQGEYLPLAAHVGGTVVAFDRRPGCLTRVNILDPAINREGSEETTVGQDELLRMVVTIALDRGLTPEESFALRLGHRAALARAASEHREPDIRDVLYALVHPLDGLADNDLTRDGFVTGDELRQWARVVALGLDEYVTGDLSGLIDGPSRDAFGQPLDLSNPLIVFDTSALGEGSRALGLVMAVTSAFVQARWSQVEGRKILINEEAYTTGRLAGVPAILRAIAKRGRATGTAVVTVLHHLSDIPEGSDLWSLVRETDVIHIFRQDKSGDADQAAAFFDLSPTLLDVIKNLPQGDHLLKIGTLPPEVVRHMRTSVEIVLTNTDQGMMTLAA